jgi:hypothetical protein
VLEKKQDEGSKARSNGGRIGNALPLMVEGLKACSKRNKTRARRYTRMGIRRGLEGVLEKKQDEGSKVHSNGDKTRA